MFFYLSTVLLILSPLFIFVYAPTERVMGDVQRIFYFHVASAWVGFFAFFVVFTASLVYILKEKVIWHQMSLASAEIGVLFTTFVIGSGMLWGRAAWNTWWTWDPRLTTTLIMWFVYLGYLFLNTAATRDKKRKLTAIYGLISFINIPLVFMSIRWWRTLHPVVIEMDGGGGLTPRMVHVMLYSLLTLTVLYLALFLFRFRQLRLKNKLREVKNSIDNVR
nr:cytochrome c biogenesis protein CcsA [Halarsenatibacter silvermanii]